MYVLMGAISQILVHIHFFIRLNKNMIRCGVQCIATNTSTKQQKRRFTNQTNNQIISQGQASNCIRCVILRVINNALK